MYDCVAATPFDLLDSPAQVPTAVHAHHVRPRRRVARAIGFCYRHHCSVPLRLPSGSATLLGETQTQHEHTGSEGAGVPAPPPSPLSPYLRATVNA